MKQIKPSVIWGMAVLVAALAYYIEKGLIAYFELEMKVIDLQHQIDQSKHERHELNTKHNRELREIQDIFHNITTELGGIKTDLENDKIHDDKKCADLIKQELDLSQIKGNIYDVQIDLYTLQDQIRQYEENEINRIKYMNKVNKQLNDIREKMNSQGHRGFGDHISGLIGSVACFMLPTMSMCQQRL